MAEPDPPLINASATASLAVWQALATGYDRGVSELKENNVPWLIQLLIPWPT